MKISQNSRLLTGNYVPGGEHAIHIRSFLNESTQQLLRRVEAFTCGTLRGCREHDDCLDDCLLNNEGSDDCQSQCDAKAMEKYGIEKAGPWLLGKGPYDGEITFEYTRHAPGAPEPAYRCPPGAIRQCGEDSCSDGPCTRFGMEFDYRNANPGAPLECKSSSRGSDGDFIGDVIKLGGDAVAERNAT